MGGGGSSTRLLPAIKEWATEIFNILGEPQAFADRTVSVPLPLEFRTHLYAHGPAAARTTQGEKNV